MTRRTAANPAPAPVPRPVLGAAVLTAVEGVSLAIGCGIYVRAILTGSPSDRGSALLGAGMGLALAALLGVVARGLARGRRLALTPVVVTQIFLLPLSWGMVQSGQWAIAAVLAAVSLAVLALLFGSAEARGTFS